MTDAGQGPVLFWHEEYATQTRRSRKTGRPVVTVAYLYVGSMGGEMATLTRSKSGKWHIAHTYPPGLVLTREQGPIDEMKAVVAGDVARWLRRLTSPALVLTEGAGI